MLDDGTRRAAEQRVVQGTVPTSADDDRRGIPLVRDLHQRPVHGDVVHHGNPVGRETGLLRQVDAPPRHELGRLGQVLVRAGRGLDVEGDDGIVSGSSAGGANRVPASHTVTTSACAGASSVPAALIARPAAGEPS